MSFLGPMHPASGVPRSSFLRAKAYGALVVAIVALALASGAWKLVGILPGLVAVYNFTLAKRAALRIRPNRDV